MKRTRVPTAGCDKSEVLRRYESGRDICAEIED
jgi:hypothetical protein